MSEPTYPLAAWHGDVRARSGRPVHEVTLEALVAGELTPDDVRASPETLLRQAAFAEQGGNAQLAENLRRAAEMVDIADDELLAFYEALRPGRSTGGQLAELAAALEARGAARCAALVREARQAYARRGLLPT